MCVGNDGWHRAGWCGGRCPRKRASNSGRHDRSDDRGRRPDDNRVVHRRPSGRSPPSPALRREGWTILSGYATRQTTAIASRDSAPRGPEWLDSGPLLLSSAVGGSRCNRITPLPATAAVLASSAVHQFSSLISAGPLVSRLPLYWRSRRDSPLDVHQRNSSPGMQVRRWCSRHRQPLALHGEVAKTVSMVPPGRWELGADGGCGSAFVSRHHRPERGDAGALPADRAAWRRTMYPS